MSRVMDANLEPKRTAIVLCIFAFAVGFFFWSVAEGRRELNNPFREIRIPTSWPKWNPGFIFSSVNVITSPFPKEIVTAVERGDTFVLSSGRKIKLAGVSLAWEDARLAKEAQDLADRLIARREAFLEYEVDYKKADRLEYAYVYFRIPIIPSNPPVGPEYVHWSLNAELIKLGYARVDHSVPFKHLDKFKQYEEEAKAQQRGLWKTL